MDKIDEVFGIFDGESQTDETEKEFDKQYLILLISGQKYGFPIKYISEIVPMPKVTPIPDMKEYDRGIITLRDHSIPLRDLRRLLGLPSLDEEDQDMIQMLKAREQDHVNWVNELIASVEEERQFALTTDPHQCAFGKWYDKYHTDDLNLSLFLSKFDTPHRKIHAVGETVIKTAAEHGYEAAKEIAYAAQNRELRLMLDLFKEVEIHVKNSHRELAVIFTLKDEFVALSADNVENIVKIKNEDIRDPKGARKSDFILGYSKVEDDTCILLDIKKIFIDSDGISVPEVIS